MAAGGVAGKDVMEKRLEQSFMALQHYFSPSRKQEGAGILPSWSSLLNMLLSELDQVSM